MVSIDEKGEVKKGGVVSIECGLVRSERGVVKSGEECAMIAGERGD